MRLLPAVAVVVGVGLVGSAAHAQAADAPDAGAAGGPQPVIEVLPPAGATPAASAPRPVGPSSFRPNKPLLFAGAGIFAAGYLPVVGAAAPSTVGLLGRIVLFVGSVGLVPIVCALGDSDGYVCRGQHGSIQLLLPIGGPLLFAENHPEDSILNVHGRPLSPFVKTALYTSSAAQLAGSLLVVTSLATAEANDGAGRPIRGRGLVVAGAMMLGGGYGVALVSGFPSLLGAALTADRKKNPNDHFGAATLPIPVFGPFLYVANEPRDEVLSPNGHLSGAARALLVGDGITQAVGLAFLATGLVMQSDEGGSASSGESSATGAPAGRFAPKLHLAPMLSGSVLGLQASLDGF